MATTKADLHRLVDELSDSDLDAAGDVLRLLAEPNGHDDAQLPAWDIAALRASIGPPTAIVHAPRITSIDQLIGNFSPEDEDPNEFDATIRRWRDSDRYTRLPD